MRFLEIAPLTIFKIILDVQHYFKHTMYIPINGVVLYL